MNKTIGIAVDSTADFPRSIIKQSGIHIIPILVTINKKKFRHGVDIKDIEIIKAIKEKQSVRTEPVVPGEYATIYEELLSKYNRIISFHASTDLSKCYTSAVNAMKILPDDEAERILVIDTGNVTIGQAMIVQRALELIKVKTEFHKMEQKLKKYIDQTSVLFTVENLYWLKRAKKLKMISVSVGGMLDRKPVIAFENGRLIVKSKHMGIGKAVKDISTLIENRYKSGKKDFHIWIAHSHTLDIALSIQETLAGSLKKNSDEIKVVDLGPTLTAYTGPGCICIAMCPTG